MTEEESAKSGNGVRGNSMEVLLEHLGMGRWTLIQIAPSLIVHALLAMHTMSGAFVAPILKYTCKLPSDANHNQPVIFQNIPGDECMYITNGTDGEELHSCTEWDFDNSTFASTFTSEFSLACHHTSFVPLYQSLYMIGCGIGSIFGGILADKFGRRPVITSGYIMYLIIAVCLIWIPYLTMILTARLFMGILHIMILQSSYVMMMEVVPGRLRSVVGMLAALPWALAMVVISGIGYFFREWRELQMFITFPYAIMLPLFWFLKESPHWLMIKGKKTEVLQVLSHAAAMHGVVYSDSVIEKLKNEITLRERIKQKIDKKTSAWEQLMGILHQFVVLIKSPKLRLRTMVICLDFFTASGAYFGLSLGAVNFSADPFIFMAVSGALEIPPYTLMGPILAYIGRKPPAVGSFLFTGIALLILPAIPSDLWQVNMMIALLGKMTVSAVFLELFIYATEIFPTEVRIQGLGTGLFVSRIASILSPFFNDLLVPVFPLAMPLVIGGLNIIAGFSSFLLPETKGEKLPSQIEDLQDLRFGMVRGIKNEEEGEEEMD